MRPPLSRALVIWLPILVATSGLFLFAYWGIQQNYRLSANDPQIEMAESGARALNAGAPPASLVTRGVPLADLTESVAPWLAVFDASGTPLESSASIGKDPLTLPSGVFDTSSWKTSYAAYGIGSTALPHNETRFSWQPRPGVREAVVLVRADNGYFVASGRSMREVEDRIHILTTGAAVLWGTTELFTLAVIALLLAVS